MSDINKTLLVARLGKAPTIKYLESGTAVCDLWVVSNSYQGKDKEEKANWFSVTVFGNKAVACEKCLDVGSQVVIEGRLDYQHWEKDGQKRNAVKIIADSVQFVGKKKEDSQQSESQPEPEPTKEPESIPAGESTPVDNQEPLKMENEFDSPIDLDEEVPF